MTSPADCWGHLPQPAWSWALPLSSGSGARPGCAPGSARVGLGVRTGQGQLWLHLSWGHPVATPWAQETTMATSPQEPQGTSVPFSTSLDPPRPPCSPRPLHTHTSLSCLSCRWKLLGGFLSWPLAPPLRKETNPPSSVGTSARGVAFSGGQLSDQGLPTLGHRAPVACRRMAGSRSSQKLLEMARAQEVLKPRRLWLTVSFRANPTKPETWRPEMLLLCCVCCALQARLEAGTRRPRVAGSSCRAGRSVGRGLDMFSLAVIRTRGMNTTARGAGLPLRGRRPTPLARAVGLPVALPIPPLALRVWQGAGLRASSQPHRGPRRSRSRPRHCGFAVTDTVAARPPLCVC